MTYANIGRPSVAFVTLGCAKNEVDSANMAASLTQAGFDVVKDPEDASAVIVNTCSFIQSAAEESIEAILDAAGLKNVESGAPLIVSGCLPARYGAELEDELPEAAAFLPCSKEDDIVAVVLHALGLACSPADVPGMPPLDAGEAAGCASAYVKISDGCDRFCSFCTIPFIRGRYHSFPAADVEAAVARHVAAGVREIVLIAQDTGRWGQDFADPSTLAALLSHLAETFPDTWFRVMYTEPVGVTDELLNVMAAHENVCSYLDIPLQHVDAGILQAMNRSGSRTEFETLVAHVRDRVPDVTLRTTLIAGFPGETEEAFEDLLDFVSEGHFDYVGVFPYSREEGTRAARLPGQIDEDEKIDRASRLRDVADAVCTARIAERVGQKAVVLVEGAEDDGQLFGRTQAQAPEVDGATYVGAGTVGDFLSVTIVDTLFYEMEGE
ncbi:30S ribosomal protein S12 methylthiotransferase RimO [Xiamenia xianingshaonis]|uniref:Ribosomal protein uS12 methylthiotransferase RimO n=1 Tax=Xiamenia xianingshaonis TaxID=2682776 RepID=A0A9E6MRI7_9ACTN|nr:30S ribosomal protein S12 methylthiotransferase RimO [Xiamenia xianingshaonis]NHM13699.1 30S ribosomal protein S12 methylthiotransferase RimO [Xiamenia xianingshaonis]QTU85068.1 30S ribosomal protein S12 methylthiotransferase RimO [Xiamenia xianingshaonis]